MSVTGLVYRAPGKTDCRQTLCCNALWWRFQCAGEAGGVSVRGSRVSRVPAQAE